jgi:hypothetical protein
VTYPLTYQFTRLLTTSRELNSSEVLRIPSGKFGFRTADVALPVCYSTQFELYTSRHKWVKQVRHLSLVICHGHLLSSSQRTNDQRPMTLLTAL